MYPHRYSSSGHLSPGVHRYCYLSVPVCPTVLEKRSIHQLKGTVKPLGEHALSCEILRWPFHRFLANTVVFLPLTLRQRTHRNAIRLSRCYSAILAQGTKSGIARMSLYFCIHLRHTWTGRISKRTLVKYHSPIPCCREKNYTSHGDDASSL